MCGSNTHICYADIIILDIAFLGTVAVTMKDVTLQEYIDIIDWFFSAVMTTTYFVPNCKFLPPRTGSSTFILTEIEEYKWCMLVNLCMRMLSKEMTNHASLP